MDIQNISEIISGIISNLFSSIDNNLYYILDDITFISSDIMNDSHFKSILGTETSVGILLLCNSLIIGFILYHALTSLFAHITLNKPLNHGKFILRLVILTIVMNCSPYICSLFLDFISMITLAIRNIGEFIFNKDICFTTLIEEINSVIYLNSSSINIFSLDGIFKSFISIGLLNLIFSYSLRYIFLKLLILLSPFSILCLVSHKTSWLFYSWLRAIMSLLLIQVVVALVLLLIFSINLQSTDLFTKILLIGSIYALIRSNNFVRELVGGISSEINLDITSLLRR